MEVTAIKTKQVRVGDTLFPILDESLPRLQEKDIVVITCKIISICEGDVVKNDGQVNKDKLIQDEADWYIDPSETAQFHVTLTIKNNILIGSSGIDESNGGGYFVLWPKNLPEITEGIWRYLREKHGLKQLGILTVDSRIIPLRWGTLGVGLSWCGFEPLKNYIGEPDIDGNNLRMTKESIIDGLAGAANVVMGEGNEQTPLALIRNAEFVTFTDRPPTPEEIAGLRIDPKDDLFAPLVDTPKWKKGGGK